MTVNLFAFDCSGGVVSLLQSAIYRSAVNRLKRTQSRLMECSFVFYSFNVVRQRTTNNGCKKARYALEISFKLVKEKFEFHFAENCKDAPH